MNDMKSNYRFCNCHLLCVMKAFLSTGRITHRCHGVKPNAWMYLSLRVRKKKCLLAHYFPEHTLEAKFVAYDCWIFFLFFTFQSVLPFQWLIYW